MEQQELNQILELHKKWLRGESGGKCANLSGEDLSGLDLIHAKLRHADLRDANLIDANLRHADLEYAYLRHANLSGANLEYTDLIRADLIHAGLRQANLRYANLRGANLRGADLGGADLRHVNTLLLKGMPVIECQLNTTEQNRRISYWKDLDIVTAGCYQGMWEEFKERVERAHGDNTVMKRKYDRVIAFIEAEVEEGDELNE